MKSFNRIAGMLLAALLVGCQGNPSRDDNEFGTSGSSPADLYANMGIAYMREGQTEIALSKLRQGLALDPNHARSYNILALIYEKLGEDTQAETNYRKAVSLSPKDPYILNAWGTFLCKDERYAEADTQFQRAVANPLYATPWVALSNAGICARKVPNLAKAEEYLRQALTKKKDYPIALAKMARISYERGNALSARGYLQRYLEVGKHTAETLWTGVRLERALGNQEQAQRYEDILRDRFPDSSEVQQLDEY